MLLSTTTRDYLDEPNNDLTYDDFTSKCEVVIERRNRLGDDHPSHTFTLSGEYKMIRPENRPNITDRVNADILAGWADVSHGNRAFLVRFDLGDMYRIAHHSWLAVIVDNYQYRHHGRSNTWQMADASLYFLHDGDLTNVPHTSVSWESLPQAVRLFPEDAVSTSGANPNGYVQLLTPVITSPSNYWRISPEFGDIRMGFDFSSLRGGTYLYPESTYMGDINDGTNWRVILRQKTPPTEIASSPSTVSIPTVSTTATPSREDLLTVEVASLKAKINAAKNAIVEATTDHEGCDSGKRDFLTSTGLFSEDEIDECFTREYEVSWTATISSSTIITASSEHDAESLFREEHLGSYSSIDEMVIDKIHSTMTPEISIDDVSEA